MRTILHERMSRAEASNWLTLILLELLKIIFCTSSPWTGWLLDHQAFHQLLRACNTAPWWLWWRPSHLLLLLLLCLLLLLQKPYVSGVRPMQEGVGKEANDPWEDDDNSHGLAERFC